jgi:hypothetical protein
MDTTGTAHQDKTATPAFRRARMLNFVHCRVVTNIILKVLEGLYFQKALYCSGTHSWLQFFIEIPLGSIN